jgi:hypothetical protein
VAIATVNIEERNERYVGFMLNLLGILVTFFVLKNFTASCV